MNHFCLICGREEPSKYAPPKDAEYVCSRCTLTLCATKGEKIQAAHDMAVVEGLYNTARGLEMFLGKGK